MAERRRPPRATAPFFMAGGDSDFYGTTGEDDHSDGELFPSHSSHDQQAGQPNQATFTSSADVYRSVPSGDHRMSFEGPPPSPGVPQSARPFLPQGPATGGFTASPGASRPGSSYRVSYSGANTVPSAGLQRSFPPSAFVDPAMAVNGDATSSNGHGTSSTHHGRRMSSEESGYKQFGAAYRNSSLTSFAPPPAPWMRTESWHESQASLSSGIRPGTLTPRKRSALPSTLLKAPVPKPWLEKKDPWARASWWITVGLFIVGILAAAVLCFFGIREVPHIGKLCMVMNDNFDSLDLSNTWTRDVNLGGLRNGDFAMFTADDKNSYASNGKLYIVPTLTSDEIGTDAVLNGGTYRLSGCTTNNASACSARSGNGKVINPVQSARLTTQNTYNIKYGRVEIRARLPRGDWLKPIIQMLPQNNEYGPYPVSGEIDILQARGNGPNYPKQGRNFVTSGLHWAPTNMPNMDQFYRTYGWRSMRHSDYSDDYHTYVLEWSPDFMWTYVDRRTARVLDLRFNKQSFYQRGHFPPTVLNNTNVPVVLNNPWQGSGNSAPFDKEFYLTVGLGVGGTDGWFLDNEGGKMWYDGSSTAMTDFARSQDTWHKTWDSDDSRKAFSIDYVKMWSKC